MQDNILSTWTGIQERLIHFVQGKVHDTELSKDIVQDVFIKVFSKGDTIKDRSKLLSWIFQVTRNEIVSNFRKRKPSEEKEGLEDADISESELTAELAQCMKPMIDDIPEKYRQALILADIKNIPQKEISEQLNISYSGAKSRVQRGRAMLKTKYEQCCHITTDVYGNVVEYQRRQTDGLSSDECG